MGAVVPILLQGDEPSRMIRLVDAQSATQNALVFPTYAACVSAVVLIYQLLAASKLVRTLRAKVSSASVSVEDGVSDDVEPAEGTGGQSSVVRHVRRLGGPVIFAFKCARLLSCIALSGLCIFAPVSEERRRLSPGLTKPDDWYQIEASGIYGYALLLALASVAAKPWLSRLASRHLSTVLFLCWAVYVYRDIWPLATFTLNPVDAAEGGILWTKIALLTIAAVVVPLCMPRQYIPLNPKEPKPPNPEQTASILSLVFYNWLDNIVFEAYRTPHLSFEQIPFLPDYHHTENLVRLSYPHLDPFQMRKHEYIFWGFMRVFRTEYTVMCLMLALRVITFFAGPIGIYRLLDYMQTGGAGAVVRPWVWVALLFLGPLSNSIVFQWYIFNAVSSMVSMEAIITQLIFDHALRIRMKAEVSDTSASDGDVTVVTTPDTASVVEPSDTQASAASPDSDSNEDEMMRSSSLKASVSQGKQKSRDDLTNGSSASTSDKPMPTSDEKTGNLVGRLNNLVTSDVDNVHMGCDFPFLIVETPMMIILCVCYLYRILGWSAFVGMGVMVVLLPLPGYVAMFVQKVQVEKMKKTDARVQTVTEIMSVIRMIKVFGWEPRMTEQLAEKRAEELQYQRTFKLLELINGYMNNILPLITMIITFATYTLVMKRDLTASSLFSSITVFTMLRQELHEVFGMVPRVIKAKVSLDRMDEFLKKTELLDVYSGAEKDGYQSRFALPSVQVGQDVIGIREAAFTWDNNTDGSVTPGRQGRKFTLRIENELVFERGHINLIVGPTGSGKTSLLMALLGEMHYIPAGSDSYVNLPRLGGVAYAAQESWVQNETIKENILFGSPYDEERYNKVIVQCGLERDLSLFNAGDETEVGEKGLTLSGGQKARITLARAVYSSAEILLLDDVLAALDVHTARWIVEKCLKGDLIRGRTVLLVTHNIAMATPISEFVVSLGTDGRISSQGGLSNALAKDDKLAAAMAEESKEIEKAEEEVDQIIPDVKQADGKLIVAEEISEGHVSWQALKLFFSSLGGRHPVAFWFWLFGSYILSELASVIQIWVLGLWARQYERHQSSEVAVSYYLSVYAVLTLVAMVLYCTCWIVYLFGTIRAWKDIHKKLISSILGTTLRWLDTTPTSRIITRCTQDIQAIDGSVSEYCYYLIELTGTMIMKLGAIVVLSPMFLVPGVVVAVFGVYCGELYMKAQLSVKRETSNARAPVLGHFGAAIAGLTSIRAYGAQDAFRKESYRRIDRYTRAARTQYNLNRWISVRIDALGGMFATGLAAYLLYGRTYDASIVGFSLNMAVGFSGLIIYWVRVFNEFEVSGNSLERIQHYTVIEQEPKPTEDGVPPAYWPASGDLRVEKLSARYSPDGPRVLEDISFEAKSGERIGIVGRTGSGKSSLTLSLLRCIMTEGKVYYDGIPTDSINLDALRSNITIIPQVPELLSGSLRRNLDPFEQHDDAVLNDALRAAGLFSVQNETDEGRITLDSQIASGGGNLSVGQRQILALARAIVRQSKLLILDEATSAIDYETDTVIQTSMRNELPKDVTILTVAHRLQTIMDADKIMVLDAGRIVEFDKPSELLKKEQGMLRALVDESGDKATLYAMAAGANASTS
ncbi:hypothetical protein AcV5_002391 [Taiwanofungus camphoratus]|nr:hypothetical protein AcV5_002391 [Antrodia cinnamomea]